MPDLHEELGRLADAVGEPVTFQTLQTARRRRDRRRRSSSIIVAFVVIAAVGAFFAATYRTEPVLPEAPPSSSPTASASVSKHGSPLQGVPPAGRPARLTAPRCLSGLRVIGNGYQLATCSYWPSGTPLTVSFAIVGSARMKLALYPARGCTEQGCDQAAVWRGQLFSGPGVTTLHIHGLRWGRRYLLIDRLHPATARALIIPG